MTRPPSSEQQAKNLGKTIIANYASNLANMKQPPLLAEDGATFHGWVKPIPGNQFQAACHAKLDLRSSVKIEQPAYSIHNTEKEAKDRIAAIAGARGFKGWFDESKDS